MKVLFTLLLIFSSWMVMAQTQVTGVITDKQGTPLAGVSISEKSSNNGVVTGSDGSYRISLSHDSVLLIFRAVGYKTQERLFVGQPTFDLTLEEDIELLNGVVVTALGLERARKELGFAVTTINGADLTQVRQTNVVNALSGRAPGVQVTNGSSGIGSSARIVIRGETSFSGTNQPLFVVDGIPISNELVANLTENLESGFQEVDYGNGASELSSDDIQSISVLKGPGAAALYGTRAANGVVLIETKDGISNNGFGVSFNSSVTFETPLRLPKYQNTYGGGAGGQFAYEDGIGGGVNDGGITSFGPKMNGQLITQFDGPSRDANNQVVRGGDVIARNGNPIEATPWVAHPNNVADFFQTGITYQNNIAVSGSNDQGSIRLSLSDLDNTGIVPNTDLNRSSIALSSTYQLTQRLSTRAFINYINSASTHRPGLGYGSENTMYLFTWMGRQNDVSSLEDYWQHGQEGFQQYNYNYQWMDNPYFSVYENTNGFSKDRLLGNIGANYQINDYLSLQLKTGMDSYHDLRQSKRAKSSQRFKNGAYREDEISFAENNINLMLSYERPLSKQWTSVFAIGGNQMQQELDYKSTTAGELSVPGIYNFGNSKIPLVVQQQRSTKRINSLLGFARFGYQSKLYLDLTVRNDWSSTLPENRNSFAYYSASASAILSEWIQLPRAISYSKLRLSAASVGNDTDPYQLNNTFVFNQNYGANPLVTNSTTLLNPELKPERLNALEAGLELWFFNDHLGLDVAAYQNTAKDQIIRLPVSSASGYTSRLANGGTLQSQGIEAALNARLWTKGDFKWTSYLNFSRNMSKVIELPEGVDRYATGYASVYASTENTVFYIADAENGRMGDMYGTGFAQINGQTIYDANGYPVRDAELRLLGNYNPDFIMGWGNEFRYKNLRFSFLFDWRQGGTIVSRTLAIGSTSGVLAHTAEGRETGIVGEGVTNVGTDSELNYQTNTQTISAQEYYNQYYNRANEESALYDASYLKLREIKLSYGLPERWIEKTGFADVQLSVIASNLWLLTENPHIDPELSAMQGRNFAYGVEDMAYPSSRSIGFSIKARL